MVDLDRRDEETPPRPPAPAGRPGPVTLRRSTCHLRRMPWHECDWWNLMPACPYTGWAINAQVRGPSTRFGRAGSLTANELRNRVSPTHSPQHANAPTEPTSIIAADQRRDGRHRDCPNPLRGNPPLTAPGRHVREQAAAPGWAAADRPRVATVCSWRSRSTWRHLSGSFLVGCGVP